MYTIDTHEDAPRFEFEIDGERYAVGLLDSIPADELLAMSKELRGIVDKNEQVGRYVELIRAKFDREAPGAVSRLTAAQWRGLLNAYLGECEVGAGEL